MLRAFRRSEPVVKAGQPHSCHGAISARQRGKRGIELWFTSNSGGNAAELNDIAADGERRVELCSLQRLCAIRQCRDPAVHAALPVFRAWYEGTISEAAQFAQGQDEEASRPERR